MDAEKNIRAFLAIEPSAEVLAAVGRLQERLKREISGSVSWTRPQGNHLTLKFFGNSDLTDVEIISAAVI
ncbi:MAG: 2'-5' RNA ligase family protein [Smithella sp.]